MTGSEIGKPGLSCNRSIETSHRHARALPKQLITPGGKGQILCSCCWYAALERAIKFRVFQRGKIRQDTIFAQHA